MRRICRISAEQLLHEILILLRIPGTCLEAIAPARRPFIHCCRTVILPIGRKKLHVNRASLDLTLADELRNRSPSCLLYKVVIVRIGAIAVTALHLEAIRHVMQGGLYILIVILAVGAVGAISSATTLCQPIQVDACARTDLLTFVVEDVSETVIDFRDRRINYGCYDLFLPDIADLLRT